MLESLFNKIAGLKALLKNRLLHRCFPVNFVKFLRTPHFFYRTSLVVASEYRICLLRSCFKFLLVDESTDVLKDRLRIVISLSDFAD